MGSVRVVHVRAADGPPPTWHDHGGVSVETVPPEFDPGSVAGAESAVVENGDAVDPMAVLRRLRAVSSTLAVVVYDPHDADADPLVFDSGGEWAAPDPVPNPGSDAAGFADALVDLVEGSEPDGTSEAVERTDALHDAAMGLVYCDDEADVYDAAVEAASNLLDLEQSIVHVAEGSKLVPAAVSGEPVIPEEEAETFDVDEGVVGQVYRTGESVLVNDAQDHETAAPSESDIRAGVCVALGETGVFVAVDDEAGAFDDRDVTLLEILAAHVRTAVDRIRSREAIERERDRVRALFENAPDPIVVAEPTSEGPRIRSVNPAFEETFGVVADAVRTEIVADVVGIPPDAERIDVPQDGHVVEEIRREADGELREFLFRGFPVSVGGDTRHVAFFTDVTERNERRRELERKTERLEEFASVVSHDLRNPLGVAKGWVEQGRQHPDMSDRALEEVAASLDRMEGLVDDLLTLAREGWTVEGTAPAHGASLVRRAWQGLDTGDADLRVEWSGRVEADLDRAVELFGNLFRNSIEHAPGDDGAAVTVTVGPLEDDDGVYVADDGPGIPPEMRDQVFEMGVTGDGGGTGLGLAIVDRIAEAHGWEISVDESEAGGARFEVRFDP